MAVRDYESVAVRPFWIVRIVFKVAAPQHFGDIGHAHGHARMAGFGFFHRVHGEGANGVREFLSIGGCHGFLGGKIRNYPSNGGNVLFDCRPEQREGFVLEPNLPTNATKLTQCFGLFDCVPIST